MVQYRFHVPSRAVVTASAVCLALLASPLACQSDNTEGGEDAEEGSPSSRDVPRRDVARIAPAPTEPNTADEAEQATAEPPNPAAVAATPDEPVAPGAAGGPNSTPAAPALAFEACTFTDSGYGDDCDTIYVTMKQMSPPRCVQLTIDNCGGYGDQGLGVDAPLSWRLASGSIGSSLSQCELGAFYSSSAVAVDAAGSITWNETTPRPTEVALNVTLEPSPLASDPASVEVVTAQPLNPVACDE